MSFSATLKRELFNKEIKEKEEIYAELFGIFISKDIITENGIYFRTENASLAKRVYSNLKAVVKMDIYLKYSISNRLGTHKVYEIKVIITEKNKKEYGELLKRLFLYKNFSNEKTENELAGIIRGFFISCGYVKSPEKGYALDFFIDTEDSATFLYYLFKQMGKKVFQTDKKSKSLVYLRNSEDILDIIFLIGGIISFFEFEEVTVNKEIRNKINRNMNWEIANEAKKLSTSEKQIKMIKYIDKEIGLSELSGILRETAETRLENEELSLQELADLMEVSKSGIRNRFRRIEEVYTNLKEKR
ncbi:DNA-binding protein WhiA [Leptotrichia sp. OH3620_COT-345]|uniref:DNA-binding protein WhiA n=1 Tax=Leptotrichia sp. OH3620_COT-345 TaxID=2491048 RepID=UPI000F652154|nr:DNA-binding protein WhiA [Leptotrichia sp. OH3620_COT-345]RRD39466.1 DNA-binding protein WhiA [Leptotrichia sp. OH3620_COT-345]